MVKGSWKFRECGKRGGFDYTIDYFKNSDNGNLSLNCNTSLLKNLVSIIIQKEDWI